MMLDKATIQLRMVNKIRSTIISTETNIQIKKMLDMHQKSIIIKKKLKKSITKRKTLISD